MIKFIRRRIRPITRAAALAFLWNNRTDVMRWARFAKRSATSTTRPTAQDLKMEARVRAAISADPALRADPSLRDVRVHDGVVVLEAPVGWHNRAIALTRVAQVKGVEAVHTAHDADERNWLDVEMLDVTISPA